MRYLSVILSVLFLCCQAGLLAWGRPAAGWANLEARVEQQVKRQTAQQTAQSAAKTANQTKKNPG